MGRERLLRPTLVWSPRKPAARERMLEALATICAARGPAGPAKRVRQEGRDDENEAVVLSLVGKVSQNRKLARSTRRRRRDAARVLSRSSSRSSYRGVLGCVGRSAAAWGGRAAWHEERADNRWWSMFCVDLSPETLKHRRGPHFRDAQGLTSPHSAGTGAD